MVFPIIFLNTNIFVILQAILNETSHGLHLLTQQQSFIKNFQIVLPKSWSIPACQPGRRVTSSRTTSSHPDITINMKDTFYPAIDGTEPRGAHLPAPQPWTEQHAGCGQQGRGIHVPSQFLDFKVADEKATLSGRRRYYKDTWELRHKGKNIIHFSGNINPILYQAFPMLGASLCFRLYIYVYEKHQILCCTPIYNLLAYMETSSKCMFSELNDRLISSKPNYRNI